MARRKEGDAPPAAVVTPAEVPVEPPVEEFSDHPAVAAPDAVPRNPAVGESKRKYPELYQSDNNVILGEMRHGHSHI